jgi:hypothetical protein
LVLPLGQFWLTLKPDLSNLAMPLQTVEPQRLYRQIAEQLRALIAGEFAPGHAFPPNATWPSSWA